VIRKGAAVIQIEAGKKYVRERMPGFFSKGRVPKYLDILYEPDGKTIKVTEAEYFSIGDRNIVFF